MPPPVIDININIILFKAGKGGVYLFVLEIKADVVFMYLYVISVPQQCMH